MTVPEEEPAKSMITDEMVRLAQSAGGVSYTLFDVRAALEAVAPVIRAAALEEAATTLEACGWYMVNPDVSWTEVELQVDYAAACVRALAKNK